MSFPDLEFIVLSHVQRDFVPFQHFVNVEEELTLYRNLSWGPQSVSLISYVCAWDLCNDPRLVETLTASIQFTADTSVIAGYLQSTDPLSSCLQCSICTNSTLDFTQCANVSCSSTGQCFIDQYVNDPQFNGCQYAFQAECEAFALESSILITATYNIDDETLYIDEVDLYCSKNNCNGPQTVQALVALISQDIQLDPVFYFQPIVTTTSPPSTASQNITGLFSFIMIATLFLFFIVF